MSTAVGVSKEIKVHPDWIRAAYRVADIFHPFENRESGLIGLAYVEVRFGHNGTRSAYRLIPTTPMTKNDN